MPQKDWNPENTLVCILGLGLKDWAEPENPDWDRTFTLKKLFKKSGVPEEQILFLDDNSGLPEKIRVSLPGLLANSDENTLFIFYYAGHGGVYENKFYFCHPNAGDDAIYDQDLYNMIEENFNGAQAILLADCCYSGKLSDMAKNRDSEIAYGVITSATSDITSTGSWTFTDTVISGFMGEGQMDADSDGTVSFQELSDYIIETMKNEENQPADYAFSANFDSSFRLAVTKDL